MRHELFNRPLRFPAQGVTLAGRQLHAILRPLAFAMLLGLRVLVTVLLRLLRPFVMWPLLLAMIGGICVAFAFAASSMWHDAMRAGLVAFVAAVVLGLYSMLVQMIDPEHFNDQVIPCRRS